MEGAGEKSAHRRRKTVYVCKTYQFSKANTPSHFPQDGFMPSFPSESRQLDSSQTTNQTSKYTFKASSTSMVSKSFSDPENELSPSTIRSGKESANLGVEDSEFGVPCLFTDITGCMAHSIDLQDWNFHHLSHFGYCDAPAPAPNDYLPCWEERMNYITSPYLGSLPESNIESGTSAWDNWHMDCDEAYNKIWRQCLLEKRLLENQYSNGNSMGTGKEKLNDNWFRWQAPSNRHGGFPHCNHFLSCPTDTEDRQLSICRVNRRLQLPSLAREELLTLDDTYSSVNGFRDDLTKRNIFEKYEWMMNSITKCNRRAVLQMLRWVKSAARPLCVCELMDAIRSEISDNFQVVDIQRISCGLLRIVLDGSVSLVHLSLRDYLESDCSKSNTLGWGAVFDTADEMIAQTCLEILSPELLLDSLSSGITHQYGHGISRASISKLQRYAYCFWKIHYIRAERQSGHLPGMLHQALRKARENRAINLNGSESDPLFRLTASNIDPMASLNASLIDGARFGMLKLVRLELEMGANPNTTDNLGYNTLHCAASTGDPDMTRLLIDYGANINAVSEYGDTPLVVAIAKGQIEVMKLLLSRDPDTQNARPERLSEITISRLCLTVLLSKSYSDCQITENNYIVSKATKDNEYGDIWPPIYIENGCSVSVPKANAASLLINIVSEQRTAVNWFPGRNMYEALRIAARFGIEKVLELLVAAGNDVKFLKRNSILEGVLSSMNIS